ncbi:MAG: DUF167 domain-containing protein [Alphaproteobacteria bacterium]|nr:DUF167 domain-containing protein [Alphaproteobacteria bacterium]
MSDAGPVPWNPIDGGLSLRVRVTPKSAADAIIGLCETPDGPAIQVKVRAIPAAGAANVAVEKLIAKWLGLPKSVVSLHSGGKSRVKLLHVLGDAPNLVGIAGTKLQCLEG